MSLPPLAEIPPPNIRLSIAPEEWQACIESWTTLAGLYLRLPPAELSGSSKSEQSLIPFLQSFYHETARSQPGDNTFHTSGAASLRRLCFALVERILSNGNKDIELLQFDFFADFCGVHAKSTSLSRFLAHIWRVREDVLGKQLEEKKSALLKALLSSSGQGAQGDFRRLIDVMRASPQAGTVFMTGSDFLDALASKYETAKSAEQKTLLVATVYFGLVSLAKTDPPQNSLLSDQLYSLKAQADKANGSPSLLADLVTNTPLTTKLRRTVGTAAGARLNGLLDSIDTYRMSSIAQPRKHPHRRKGKGKAPQADGEMHMHRMSLVTQVQDLFPDLGSGFVLRLLDEYNDDVEQVTAHLLDDSLPPHLRDLDRTEQAPIFDTTQQQQIDDLAPRSTPPPQHEPFLPDRRNVFDNDELDRLEFDTSKLHLGKRDEAQTEAQPNKAAILSALAAFDSDDDERDDTYDVDDVGGTVDTAHPDGEPGPAAAKVTQEENEMALFSAYRATPELFGRTFDVRRGQARQALKAETGMTDEQIEGWAVMLQRDPGRLKKLEARLGLFDSGQGALGRSAWRETDTEDSDAAGAAGRGGSAGRGRGGRGRGGRGRGGNVAGPSSDPNTAKAQRNKEANKGSRANHNRRDQRARKMARGGFSG